VSDQEPDPDEAPITATPEPESEPGAGESEAFADTASGAAPAQFTAGQWEQPEMPTNVGKSTKGRGRSRAAWAVGLGLGYVILATGTAFGVIIDKTPTAVDVTAVNASAYAAQAGAGSRGSASAHASGKAKPKASASPSTAPTSASPTPTPTPTVTGSVSDGIHSGDLRYFLLPPPQGASSVQGDPNGTTETIDDVLAAYDDASTARSNLEQLDFKTACTRTYQDSTMGANVTIELMQFGSSAESQEWFSDFEFSGGGYQSISVSGESGAEGWSYADNGTYELIGAYREGDTFYEVTIFSSQLIPAPDLGQVVSAEHARLANG
jgi:hypothetical protein